ncbi:MAG: FAD-dependent oxidoreductase, partial [Dehalococcoidia bacterium]|nr:FAD-dependent oxidoreductase [Dehalococcoidia bacterium]
SGKADLVAIGRASLADPEFAVKAAEGRDEDIVKCLSCNEGCIDALMSKPPITCTQNPALGREVEYASAGAANVKKVVVAGGGPAGLEAARTAALWGHRVTLYEKRDSLGGQALLAAMPPTKEVWLEVVRSRTKDLKRLAVETKVGCELTPQLVKELSPDVLIVATGSAPLLPDIPGTERDSVVTAQDVLTGAPVGARVVVIGGGLVGCETADYLAQQGKDVTIVEMLRYTARDISPAARYFLRRRLRERNVQILTSTPVKAITDKGVVISSNGEERTLGPVDTVVLATGARSVNDLEAVKELVPEVHVIGDAASPGKMLQAVQQAAEVARSL